MSKGHIARAVFAFILIGSLVVPRLSLAATIFSDNFASGGFVTGGWNEVDSTWSVTGGQARVDGDTGFNDDNLRKNVATTGFSSIVLSYKYRVSNSLNNGDHLYVEWSLNGGSSWNTERDYSNISATSSLISESIALSPSAANKTNFQLRFRAHFNQDFPGDTDTVLIDDVLLSGTAAANSAPTATMQSVSTNEDTAKPITLAGTDSDGSIVSFGIVSGPARGVISGFNSASGTLTYTPLLNYAGPDTFTFRVTDNNGATSTPAAVNITVNPINDAPMITALSITAPAGLYTNNTLGSLISSSDVDGDPVTVSYQWKKNGTDIPGATSNNLDLSVAGNGDKNDVITLQAIVRDAATSSAAVVSSGVTILNTRPTAVAQSLITDEDTALPITLVATDPDGDTLTYNATAPTNGMLDPIAIDQTTYNPAANYNGADSFSFSANDGEASGPSATINITVNAINDSPALDHIGNQSVNELLPLTFTAHAADPEGDAFTYSLSGAPSGAEINADTGAFSWTPAEDQGPNDYTFIVRATQTDDSSKFDEESITVQVNEVNQAPVSDSGTATTTANQAVAISLSGHDDDLPANMLTYFIATAPLHGSLVLSGNEVVYTPDADFGGYDSFQFQIFDNSSLGDDAYSNVSTVKITVVDPPHATPAAGSYFGDQDVSFAAMGASSIRYTVDGTDPSCATGLLYDGPITIRSNNTFRVISCYDGGSEGGYPIADSGVQSFVYVYENGGEPGGGGGSASGVGPAPSAGGGRVLGASTSTVAESGTSSSTVGEVLGETTSTPATCDPYLTSYLFFGSGANPADQVVKLQKFLGVEGEAGYGKATRTAVKAFQKKYFDDILAPWIPFGLKSSEKDGTGSVYKLTLWKINSLQCPGATITKPSIP